MNYKTAFDRITTAYVNDKLNPYDNCGCFIGNLLGNKSTWSNARGGSPEDFRSCPAKIQPYTRNSITKAKTFIRKASKGMYTVKNICDMENNFLKTLWENCPFSMYDDDVAWADPVHPDYENALFTAMESTLDMLKEIHVSKGEGVEEYEFTKRQLEVV